MTYAGPVEVRDGDSAYLLVHAPGWYGEVSPTGGAFHDGVVIRMPLSEVTSHELLGHYGFDMWAKGRRRLVNRAAAPVVGVPWALSFRAAATGMCHPWTTGTVTSVRRVVLGDQVPDSPAGLL